MSEEIIDDNDGTSRRRVERSEKNIFTDYFSTDNLSSSSCDIDNHHHSLSYLLNILSVDLFIDTAVMKTNTFSLSRSLYYFHFITLLQVDQREKRMTENECKECQLYTSI